MTKFSTEAELVDFSDSAAQAIHLRNFVIEQGYSVSPVVVYQGNLSSMVLTKRRGLGSGPSCKWSRHIYIRYFFIAEEVVPGDVIIEHLSTDLRYANAPIKTVPGAQFERERHGLTIWVWILDSVRTSIFYGV